MFGAGAQEKSLDICVKRAYNIRMKKQAKEVKDISLGTRYPPEVLSEMKQLAKEHERSFNAEVIWALRYYIATQKGEKDAKKSV